MLILISLSRDVLGQNSEGGNISGKAIDSWQGNPVPAVIVSVRGTTLATETDGSGSYLVSGVPAGSYTLVFTKNGYERVVVPDVRVAAGVETKADAKLGPVFFEMDAFEAVTEPILEQNLEILQTRKKQAVVMDALGEDYISQISASDATDVAKKITGVTIQEGKFIVVRGLSDRYTSSSLNGAEIPSADADRQAAQLDLITADMIKRMEVSKTFTPDMPGGFAGGAVNIVTKTFPDRFTFNFSAGVSYNANNNLRDDFAGSERGGTDLLAIDDGLRELPQDLVTLYQALEDTGGSMTITLPSGAPFTVTGITRGYVQNLENGGLFNLVWNPLIGEDGEVRLGKILNAVDPLKQFGPVAGNSGLDNSYSLSFGDNYKILGKESGFFAGINYDYGQSMVQDRKRRSFDTGATGVIHSDKNTSVTNAMTSVKWGATFTTGIKPSEPHELGFNFSQVQAADDFRASLFYDHPDFAGGVQEYQSVYTERTFRNFQLFGRHEFPELADLGIEWTSSLTDVSQDDPNQARALFGDQNGTGAFESGQTGLEPANPQRIWRAINENNINNRFDLDLPYSIREVLEGKISTGLYQSESTRDYREEGFAISGSIVNTRDGTVDQGSVAATGNAELVQPLQLFDYDGERSVKAVYGMMELPVTEAIKLVGGGRLETTDLTVISVRKDLAAGSPGKTVTVSRQEEDVLPALGMVFTPTDKWKLTLHWSETIARPTYREIASARFTDYQNLRFIDGNPDLKFSASRNFDVRLEHFPKEGEVISTGVFYKEISDPIEVRRTDSENPNFEYFNPESGLARVMGAEFEYRRNLTVFRDYLANYSIGFNFAYIFSEVENIESTLKTGKKWAFRDTRPLYDQSPIIANADLTYNNPRSGIESTLSYNFRDRRLTSVELNGPDLYEESVGTLDFSIGKKFGRDKRFKVKFSAKNLLDPLITTSIDREFQEYVVAGNPHRNSFRRGRSYGLSMSYKF